MKLYVKILVMGFWLWVCTAVVIWYSFWYIMRPKPGKTLMLILGSGGHTTEILRLIENWDGPIIGVHASNDQLSKTRFLCQYTGTTFSVFRSRNVGQSYFTSIFTTIYSFLPAFWIIFRTNPDLIITNGPGTALPICYSAFINKILTLHAVKIVFVESICRTKTISLAGKLIYPITSEFYVQWEELREEYPRAKYLGLLA